MNISYLNMNTLYFNFVFTKVTKYTVLNQITSSPDERRNVSELYQRMTVGELRVYIPQIDWQRYLTIVLDRPCNVSESVVVFALRYLEDLVSLLGKTEPRYLFESN